MIAFSVPSFVIYTSFDTQVGETYWVPGTFCAVTIFPTRILFIDFSCKEERIIHDLIYSSDKTFVDLFQVECQWDRSRLVVMIREGHSSCTFTLEKNPNDLRGCLLRLLRGKFLSLRNHHCNELITISRREGLLISSEGLSISTFGDLILSEMSNIPKIAFGVNKQKCWHKMSKRANPAELLPCIYAMAYRLPDNIMLEASLVINEDRFKLLDQLFLHVWLRHFYSCGIPSWSDRKHYGLKSIFEGEGSPLMILKVFGALIIKSFIRVDGDHLFFLESLPKWSSCGRFRKIPLWFGSVCLCWSCGRLRICVLTVEKDFFCYLVFPKGVRSVRITTKGHGPGICHTVGNDPMSMILHEGHTYCFDNFEH